MSGLARKMKREKMKQQYSRFAEQWRTEKFYQKYLIEAGTPVSGNVILHGEDKINKLGRKPTFKMFSEHVARLKLNPTTQEQTPETGKVEVKDTEWD
jgi:hypothetical protein